EPHGSHGVADAGGAAERAERLGNPRSADVPRTGRAGRVAGNAVSRLRRVWRLPFAAILCAAFALSAPAAAQPLSATLLFDVRDTTDAPLAGVSLSVVHVPTGVERRATTTASGTAVIPLLAPGDYDVAATLAGFRRTTIDRFHLAAGAKRAFTLVLEPGDVSATVTVTADAARTRMSSGAVG